METPGTVARPFLKQLQVVHWWTATLVTRDFSWKITGELASLVCLFAFYFFRYEQQPGTRLGINYAPRQDVLKRPCSSWSSAVLGFEEVRFPKVAWSNLQASPGEPQTG